MDKLLNEKIEENIVTLIEDEDMGNGAGSPAVITAVTAVTALLGVTSGCTSDCWHPGQ